MDPIVKPESAISGVKLGWKGVFRKGCSPPKATPKGREPERAISKEKLRSAAIEPVRREGVQKGKDKGRGENKGEPCSRKPKEKYGIHVSSAMKAAQKRLEEQHRKEKVQALESGKLLDNPVRGSHRNPEAQYSTEVIDPAKRGRRIVLATAWIGRNVTKRAIRDFERSAKRYGNVDAEADRLRSTRVR